MWMILQSHSPQERLVHDLFKNLGLHMHVGTHAKIEEETRKIIVKGKASKTECVFYAAPGYLK